MCEELGCFDNFLGLELGECRGGEPDCCYSEAGEVRGYVREGGQDGRGEWFEGGVGGGDEDTDADALWGGHFRGRGDGCSLMKSGAVEVSRGR